MDFWEGVSQALEETLKHVGETKVADVIKVEGSSIIRAGPVVNIILKSETEERRIGGSTDDSPEETEEISLQVMSRNSWGAEGSCGTLRLLSKPAKYVIICHTDTEELFSFSQNATSMRQMQSYHVGVKKWPDIGYNFCVGSDGNIYEGRGWGVEGKHTLSWNHHSIGIAFIGNFDDKLPPDIALENCQKLINIGVSLGCIIPNYQLLGHCQCRVGFTSPGNKLFEEISTWKNFNRHL